MAIEYRRTPEQIVELSGRMHERFLFGVVRVNDPNYRLEEEALIQQYRNRRMPVPFPEAMKVIKLFQPFDSDSHRMVDPASPKKQFPCALRKFVADQLGLKGAEGKRVHFYTAVGSLIDFGIDKGISGDAVIEIHAKKQDEPSQYVLLDAKAYSKGEFEEKEEWRGVTNRVMVYGEIPDPYFDKKAFDNKVAEVGEEIIKKLAISG